MTPMNLTLFQDLYTDLKTKYPSDGRRKRRLRVAEIFWNLESEQKSQLAAIYSQVGRIFPF